MHIVTNSPSDAWIKATQTIYNQGDNLGDLREILCMRIDMEYKKDWFDKTFDDNFREIFGDERIDYAKSVTFVPPEVNPMFEDEKIYSQNKPGKWTETYWGRLIEYNGSFNQIEQVIKRLREHKASKTIVANIYDASSDGKKTMSGMPCLLSLDFKPRNGKLNLIAYFRSQAVSKSGYADYTALIEMGEFLCKEADIEFNKVINIAGSCHVRNQKNEMKNSKLLLEKLGMKL